MAESHPIPTDSRFKNLTGQRYGRLVIVSFAGYGTHKRSSISRNTRRPKLWNCRCDCGNECRATTSNLRQGVTSSCGCLHRDAITTHGKTRSPAYYTWQSMKIRCYNAKHKKFSFYGGRGITICDRWRDSFENFLADMGERPKGTTIERIDNDGNYEPGNCRWATKREQANNTRANRKIGHDGHTETVTQAARAAGMKPDTLFSRLDRGWKVARAIGVPVKHKAKSCR